MTTGETAARNEQSVPKNALVTISLRRDSRSTEAVVRHWIVAIAELCGKELTPALVGLWCQLLADIEVGLLDRALEETAKTCGRFFPTPGEVRARISQAEQIGRQAEGNDAWESALNYAQRHYHPDLGISRNAPELPPRIERAIRDAGGLRWVGYDCPDEKLEWAKKAFLASLQNSAELVKVAELLPAGSEARNILRQLVTSAESLARKTLAPAAQPQPLGEFLAPDDPIHAGFAALREKINTPDPVPAPRSAQEFEDRKRRVLAQFNRHLQEHPELSAGAPSAEAPLVLEHTR